MEQKHGPGSLRESAAAADEAVWSGAHQNDLPDDAFAYIEPGGQKDDTGRTKPRSLRHLPFKNASGKVDPAHVRNALARLSQTQIPADAKASARRKLAAAAKSVGVEVSDEEDAKESAFAPTPLLGNPTVATLTTTFIEDNAVSLNGRQYPQSAVDRLIQSAQLHLSAPNAAPLTCYISHEAADKDDSLKLAGKITQVWREGTKGKAKIALVNTEAGRTMATQAIGGFLRTMSLRASNAEIQRPKDAAWPVVGGNSLNLDGIDFTSTPGLEVAKIDDVALAENANGGPQRLHEVFDAHAQLVEVAQKEAPMDPIREADQGGNMAGGYTPTSGNAPSVDGAPSGGEYGQKMYKKPDDTSGGQMAGMAPAPELQEAHDRIAMVQGRSCAPGRESKAWRKALRSMTEAEQQSTVKLWQLLEAGRIREAGKSLSARNDGHLNVAHDSLARHMQMDCEGAKSKPGFGAQPADDGMNDGDDDDQQSARPTGGLAEQHKEQQEMPPTPEEAAKILEAAGYKIEKPKTAEEELQERLAAMNAEHAQRLEEMKAEQARQLEEQQKRLQEEMRALIAQATPDPQRRSLVLGSNVAESANGRHRPLHGKYLQEKIKALDWERMAYDRTTPLPTDIIPLDLLMREFEHMYAVSYDDWAKQVYNFTPVYER